MKGFEMDLKGFWIRHSASRTRMKGFEMDLKGFLFVGLRRGLDGRIRPYISTKEKSSGKTNFKS